MGEDVGKLGGVFRITDGLQKDFGDERVIDTPLAESGIIGTAVGLAIRGYRPVCEIQFDGFVYPAYDQIVSQVAKMHYRSRGKAADADRHPDPVRRRHRRGRAPLRVARGVLRAHRRPQGRRLLQPGRRVLDDPAGHRHRRPDRLPGAQAALLGEGRGRHRRATPRVPAVRAPGWSAAATTPPCWPTGRWCAPRWTRRRPPPRTAASWRSSTCARSPRWTWTRCSSRCAGPAAASSCTRRRQPRPRRRDRRPDHRGVLLLAGGAGAAGDRLRHPLPGRRGWRRSTCPTSTGCSTPSTARSGLSERRCRDQASSTCPTSARA